MLPGFRKSFDEDRTTVQIGLKLLTLG